MQHITRSDRRPMRLPMTTSLGMALAGLCLTSAMAAVPIVVPNGDFSDPANHGTVGGGVLGGSGADVEIGAGPWLGTYNGILLLLAPPTLAIDSEAQTATINGIAGALSGLNLLNNNGYFSQTLPDTYQIGRLYVASVDVTSSTPLALDLLGSNNAGIALVSNDVVVASSTNAPETMIDFNLQEENTFQLRFGYVAGLEATGNIGIRLFNQPEGLAGLDLVPTMTFSNVQLEAREIGNPTLVDIGTVGGDTQLPIDDPQGIELIAIVRDEDGDGVPGQEVVFDAPGDGPSAMLENNNGDSGLQVTAMTDLDGIARAWAMPNEQAGCYRVIATAVAGNLDQAMFHLRNYTDNPSSDSVYCNGYQ
jgi:hypothetical protein